MFRVTSGIFKPESPLTRSNSESPLLFRAGEGVLSPIEAIRSYCLSAARDDFGKPLSGTVVILGFGNRDDSLPELFRQFEKVVVIDSLAVQMLLGKLSSLNREKVKIIQADLTGCFPEYLKRFQSVLSESRTASQFIDQFNLLNLEMIAFLSKREETVLKLEEPVSFVVSSGIITEMNQQLLTIFCDQYTRKFGEEFPLDSVERTFLAVKSKLEENHLGLMQSLLRADGKAYFEDIEEEFRVVPRLTSNFKQPDQIVFKELKICHLPETFKGNVVRYFSIQSESTWSVRLSQPHVELRESRKSPTYVESIKVSHGRVVQFLALTLIPKKA